MKNKNTDWGVIIARFQTPYLHQVFKDQIDEVVNKHPNVAILLGLSQVPSSRNNPLDYRARKQMILAEYPDIEMGFIKDIKSNEQWVSNVDHIIGGFVNNGQTATVYGGGSTAINTYDQYGGKYPHEPLDSQSILSYDEICSDVMKRPPYSDDFRSGVVWSQLNQFPKAHPTVDVAIIEDTDSGRFVYMCRKPHETKYQFVGGFADPESESYEDDGRREVREETTLDVSDLKYIGSFKIDDFRYADEVDKIKTVFFTAKYQFGRAEARDDIAEVRRFRFSELNHSNIIPEHHKLFDALLDELHD